MKEEPEIGNLLNLTSYMYVKFIILRNVLNIGFSFLVLL